MKKEIACCLCRKYNYELMFVQGGRKIVRCKNDGLVFVNPPLTAEEIYHLYNDRYFESPQFRGKTCIGYYAYIDERPLLLKYFRRKIELLKRLTGGRKILEVGCGHGFFLEEARRAKLDALGIDISGYAIEYARKNKLNARLVDLFDAHFKTDSFDAVVAFQLIEHIPDPLRFMGEINRVTRSGGAILLATPNQGGYLRKIMGRYWLSYKHQEHLFFFSPATIKLLLEKAGFTHIRFWDDETRFYPLRHVLGGVHYYLKRPFFAKLAQLLGAILEKLRLLDFQIPLPLDTLIITAQKP